MEAYLCMRERSVSRSVRAHQRDTSKLRKKTTPPQFSLLTHIMQACDLTFRFQYVYFNIHENKVFLNFFHFYNIIHYYGGAQ
jgi:hypothetical protein